ncbi:MAG: flavodoxin domain-containing protein [Pseudomonadota bacterium]
MNTLSSVLQAPADAGPLVELPEGAPFDPVQREWLNGLLTGLNAVIAASQADAEAEPVATPLKVFYGSQSGNCEVLSRGIRKFSATRGFDAELAELDSITPADLANLTHVLILCATFGEGEPPDNAAHFHTALMAEDAPPLPASLQFSVCGLGDSSYTHFNRVATDIHNRLTALGATPCHELVLCDAAFEDDFALWQEGVFASEAFTAASATVTARAPANDDDTTPRYTKRNPFVANLIEARSLSGEHSAKRVNHVAISLAGGGSDVDYHVGDALGVWPLNCPTEVEDLLVAGGFSGTEVVRLKTGPATLRVVLRSQLDIHTVNANARERWGVSKPADSQHVFDVLSTLGSPLDAQTFVDGLRPLQPRLYSIASSAKKHPGEVHITVGEVHYELFGTPRKGVASTWLGNRLAAGNNLGVYIHPAPHFHITSDDTAPVIMIGPGTGIAPFRSFLEEREMRGATGDNWLFFGDQHARQDFLYREDIEAWHASGLLTRLSLAWSRDTETKIYVQHLITEQAETFFDWLERGASVYVCGDATRMATDVDNAIRSVIMGCAGVDQDGADAYVDQLIASHRYQRDVY